MNCHSEKWNLIQDWKWDHFYSRLALFFIEWNSTKNLENMHTYGAAHAQECSGSATGANSAIGCKTAQRPRRITTITGHCHCTCITDVTVCGVWSCGSYWFMIALIGSRLSPCVVSRSASVSNLKSWAIPNKIREIESMATIRRTIRCLLWRNGTPWLCGAGTLSVTPVPYAESRLWVSYVLVMFLSIPHFASDLIFYFIYFAPL